MIHFKYSFFASIMEPSAEQANQTEDVKCKRNLFSYWGYSNTSWTLFDQS